MQLDYDAILLLSYGGPYKTDDIIPFLKNVSQGANLPESRLKEVGQHYYLFNGKSPINDENLSLIKNLKKSLKALDIEIPIIYGCRNWHPYTKDALRDAVAFGARKILVIITAAYLSYSSYRQYSEHLAETKKEIANETGIDLKFDILRPYFNDKKFIDANIECILDASDSYEDNIYLACVTHSIPLSMDAASAKTYDASYSAQHKEVMRLILENMPLNARNKITDYSLSYCSRSGNPATPWLEPDILDTIDKVHSAGYKNIIVAPIGFITDHMEVVYDLDTEAYKAAKDLGLNFIRSATASHCDIFYDMLSCLIKDRILRNNGFPGISKTVGKYNAISDSQPYNSCFKEDGVDTKKEILQ